jgi:hypothetical protein
LTPDNRFAQFYEARSRMSMDWSHPEQIEADCRPFLKGTVDRALHAEVLANLGDLYFRAGRLPEARAHYADSFDAYTMPHIDRINYRAQRRLGGQ